MRTTFIFLPFIFIHSITALAQISAQKILQNVVRNLDTCHLLYYEVESIETNPFSEMDTITTKSAETVFFNSPGIIEKQNILRKSNNYKTSSRIVYKNDTLFDIDQKKQLYTMSLHPKEISNSLSNFRSEIEYALKRNPDRIFLRQDTIINNVSCYNIYINAYDTIKNNNHYYTHLFLYLSKDTFMPIYTKKIGAGYAEKDGYKLGRLNFFSEKLFHNYKFSSSILSEAFLVDKSPFKLKKIEMLTSGAIAPKIQVREISNNKLINASYFKNKMILIEFGSTVCAANPLANPMLNRLNKKFTKEGLVVIGVYSQETSNQIENYINHNHIKFPIFKGDINMLTAFQVVATPNFYLIDNSGKIVKSFNGYSAHLEKQITDEISLLINKNFAGSNDKQPN